MLPPPEAQDASGVQRRTGFTITAADVEGFDLDDASVVVVRWPRLTQELACKSRSGRRPSPLLRVATSIASRMRYGSGR